jgi:hypothetical protein
MAGVTFTEHVATLEHLVAHVLQTTAQGEHLQDCRCTVGMFDGDPIRQEIIAEGGGCQRRIACRRVHDPAHYCASLVLRGVSRRGTMIGGLP